MVKKIPTLYRRDPANRARVIVGDVTPGCGHPGGRMAKLKVRDLAWA